MTFREALTYLSSFTNYEKKLQDLKFKNTHLQRVAHILSLLDSPQNCYQIIHIAGSKGKGSVCAFTSQILKEAGYTVGLYTSPHLYDVRERIRILSLGRQTQKDALFDDCIPKEDFASLLTQLKPVIKKYERSPKFGHLTYFEVLTILAFLYFKKERVGFVVLETGLGGRLDATNVCHPLVCAITPISLEHTAILGKTLKQIAKEKAGIIKKVAGSAVPIVVSAPQATEVLRVIKKRCHAINAKLFPGKKTKLFSSGPRGQTFSINGQVFEIALLGRHQIDNAAVAVAIIEALRRQGVFIRAFAVPRGLAGTRWPLRFEIFKKSVVLDAAHNPESCSKLTETIKTIFPGRKAVFVFGCSDDKDVEGMIRHLNPVAKRFVLTQARHPRAYVWKPSNVKKIFKTRDVTIVRSVREACHQGSKKQGKRDLLVVTGSIFVSAEAKKLL